MRKIALNTPLYNEKQNVKFLFIVSDDLMEKNPELNEISKMWVFKSYKDVKSNHSDYS